MILSEKRKKNFQWVDWLRGLGIFLVVWGHISYVNPMNEYRIGAVIYSFHMPLLFFVSAFGTGYGRKYDTDTKYYLKKIVGQGIPYFIFSILYILMNATLNKYVATNTVVEYGDILTLPVRPVAQYWFLWALLIYSTITPLVISRYKYEWQEKISVLLSLIIAIVILTTTELNSVYYKVLAMWSVYILGFVVGKNWKQSENSRRGIKYILFCLYILFTYFVCIRSISTMGNEVIVAVLKLGIWISCVAFWGIVFVIMNKFTLFCWINKFSAYLGHNSIYIFIFHSYFLSFSRIFIRRIGINSVGMEFVIAMCLGLGGSLLIGFISKKNKYLDFCFYPTKYIKRWRIDK